MSEVNSALLTKVMAGVGAGLLAIAGLWYLSLPVESKEIVPEKEERKLKKAKAGPRRKIPPTLAEVPMPRLAQTQSTPVQPVRECKLEMKNGVLTKASLMTTFATIKDRVSERYKTIHDEFLEKRKPLFRTDKEAYRKAVQDYSACLTKINDVICKEVFDEYEMTELDFGRALLPHLHDMEVAQAMLATIIDFSLIIELTEVPEDLTLEVFAECYKTLAELIEQKAESETVNTQEDVVIIQAEVEDELIEKFGYKNIVILAASKKYAGDLRTKEYTRKINLVTRKLMEAAKKNEL